MATERERAVFKRLQEVLALPAAQREAAARASLGLDAQQVEELLDLVRREAVEARAAAAPPPPLAEARDTQALRAYLAFAESVPEMATLDIAACCRRHPDLAEALRGLHTAFERIVLARRRLGQPAAAAAPVELTAGDVLVLARLAARAAPGERLVVKDDVGGGGMGVVRRVWDTELDRPLAMKSIRPSRGDGHDRLQVLRRFLNEARITGQLDHPGIVPVHELGFDERGAPYFTMRLVKGRELTELIARMRAGNPEWTLNRLLGVLQRVCEAMAFAHDKKVIHRDLKPDNIMVGEFGETYVMDWGLARTLDQNDPVDLRLKGDGHAAVPGVSAARGLSDEPELLTADGDVLGTACYMSPEQAHGRIAEMGPAADIYSLGAILYHVLTGQRPYVEAGEKVGAWTVVGRVRKYAPAPVNRLDPDSSAELQSICEKAMQREPAKRYASAAEMAADLRAWLEGRVVTAHETGALAELRKWVGRNRAFAISACAAVLLAVGAAWLLTWQAQDHATTIEAKATEIKVEKENVESLSDRRELGLLVAEAGKLWPISSRLVAPCEDWIRRAQPLLTHKPGHEARLAALRAGSLPGPERSETVDPRRLGMRAELEDIQRKLQRPDYEAARTPRSPTSDALRLRADELTTALQARVVELGDETRSWQAEQLAILVDELRDFVGPEGTLASVTLRLAASREVRKASLEDCAAAWEAAVRSIADREECPAYDGLRIVPEEGLIPLGRDARSGFWEFLVQGTGEAPPSQGAEFELANETGIVLVLIPGGEFMMGAEAEQGLQVDPYATALWGPVNRVRLDPYFIGKCEVTQGQWRRLGGGDPSGHWMQPGATADMHPVERVSWLDCVPLLARRGLVLPTEAQWEHSARAGTRTRWWFGNDQALIEWTGNITDQSLRYSGGDRSWQYLPWDDCAPLHARADAFAPNWFGLHGIVGNVFEWCLDGADNEEVGPWLRAYEFPVDPRSGERLLVSTEKRVVRGGCYQLVASYSAAAAGAPDSPTSGP